MDVNKWVQSLPAAQVSELAALVSASSALVTIVLTFKRTRVETLRDKSRSVVWNVELIEGDRKGGRLFKLTNAGEFVAEKVVIEFEYNVFMPPTFTKVEKRDLFDFKAGMSRPLSLGSKYFSVTHAYISYKDTYSKKWVEDVWIDLR